MEDQTLTYTFIGITWLTMFVLFIVLTFLYINYRTKIQKKETEKRMIAFKASIEAEERQKHRIANDLHDEIRTLITGIIHGIDAATVNSTDEKLENEHLERSKEIALQLDERIKAVSLELMPKVLIEFGFVKAMSKHLEKLNTLSCTVKFVNKTPFTDELPLEKDFEVHLYRICLEVLNNLKKHAGFSFLEVFVSTHTNNLIISFQHDGRGVTNKQIETYSISSAGLGLKSMDSRLRIINGKLNYSVKPEIAIVDLKIPFSL